MEDITGAAEPLPLPVDETLLECRPGPGGETDEPSYQATLGYTAKKTIRADIAWTQEHIGHAETGGWLFASPRNPNYILLATVPGADASIGRDTISLGYEQMEAVQRLHPDLELVGDWHLHPGGGDVPSDADLRSSVHGAKLARGCWYSLIATPSTTWRPEPELHGWITFGPRPDLLISERLRLVT